MDVTSDEFRKAMEKTDAIILDTRTEDEHHTQKIPCSTLLSIHWNSFREKARELDKEKTYLVYCRSGSRSRLAVKILQEEGIKNIYHLKNGILEWINEGFETE